MITEKETAVQELKLSCREAGLMLRVIDLNKNYKDYKPEEIEATRHYVDCESCMRLGLPEILGKQIDCREALEICAKRPGPIQFYPARTPFPMADTIWEEMAYEHVNGRWVLFGNGIKGYDTHFDSCAGPCYKFLRYWLSVPISSGYDGDHEKANQIPFMIKLFIEQGWPIDNLLKIQYDHLRNILKDINYLIIDEVFSNLKVLQSLVCPDKQK